MGALFAKSYSILVRSADRANFVNTSSLLSLVLLVTFYSDFFFIMLR